MDCAEVHLASSTFAISGTLQSYVTVSNLIYKECIRHFIESYHLYYALKGTAINLSAFRNNALFLEWQQKN